MLRFLKSDVLKALEKGPLYSGSFVRRIEGEKKQAVSEYKVCLIGEVLRSVKKYSKIEELIEDTSVIKYPVYELAEKAIKFNETKALSLFKKEDPSIEDINKFLIHQNHHLSLISSEFERLMFDVPFENPATPEIKQSLKVFISKNLPEVIKEL